MLLYTLVINVVYYQYRPPSGKADSLVQYCSSRRVKCSCQIQKRPIRSRVVINLVLGRVGLGLSPIFALFPSYLLNHSLENHETKSVRFVVHCSMHWHPPFLLILISWFYINLLLIVLYILFCKIVFLLFSSSWYRSTRHLKHCRLVSSASSFNTVFITFQHDICFNVVNILNKKISTNK